jgi:hypothetical protein
MMVQLLGYSVGGRMALYLPEAGESQDWGLRSFFSDQFSLVSRLDWVENWQKARLVLQLLDQSMRFSNCDKIALVCILSEGELMTPILKTAWYLAAPQVEMTMASMMLMVAYDSLVNFSIIV